MEYNLHHHTVNVYNFIVSAKVPINFGACYIKCIAANLYLSSII